MIAKHQPKISSPKTLTLLQAAARGDESARQALIVQYLPLVRRIARKRKALLNPGERSDLVQEGLFALTIAIDRCRPNQRAHFASYAGSWIRGQMAQFTQDHGSLVLGPSKPNKDESKVVLDDKKVASYAKAEHEVVEIDCSEEEDRHDDDLATEPRRRSGYFQGPSRRSDLSLDEIPEDYLAHELDAETLLIAREEVEAQNKWLHEALARLEESDRTLITAHWLTQPTLSLRALALERHTSFSRMTLTHRRALARLRHELEKRRQAQRSTRQRYERRRASHPA